MRIAVVSDIHANLHALEAVLADVDSAETDELWCLGDLVGYGPRPNECCRIVRDRAAISLCGNHDLAVVGTLDLAEFAGDAATAARWTRDVLEPAERAWLATLSPAGERAGIELYHASPHDPVWEYVLTENVALRGLQASTSPVVLIGHSHVPLAVSWDGDGIAGGTAPDATEIDLSGKRFLLNPGSVGQPRDGDPRAAWLLLDVAAGHATYRRVSYDVALTQAEMAECGLPAALAERLAFGI